MKKTNFTESKILSIINQYEGGRPIDDLCRENGISKATVYNRAPFLRHAPPMAHIRGGGQGLSRSKNHDSFFSWRSVLFSIERKKTGVVLSASDEATALLIS